MSDGVFGLDGIGCSHSCRGGDCCCWVCSSIWGLRCVWRLMVAIQTTLDRENEILQINIPNVEDV